MTQHEQETPLRILLIDDNENDRVAFRRAFKKSDMVVEIVEYVRAEDALQDLREHTPAFDIMITDYKLPGMNGLAFCKELLKHNISFPLVLLTGAGSEHLAVEALKAGVNDYIIKDSSAGYSNLLPVVIPEVIRKYHDRLARQRAEEEIRRMNKELEHKLLLSQKMIALGSLVAETTHEINTPVSTGITAASGLIEKIRDLEQVYHDGDMARSDLERYLTTAEEAAQIILSNLKRAADLIKSFKVVAVDQCSETRRRFNMKDYLEEVLLSLRPKLKKTRHTVRLTCSETLELDSNPGALSQIISNLVINSLVHGFTSGDQGQIGIEVQRKHDTVDLTYSDNGKGIPPEDLANIFDPFFTTTREKGGSGLGLNIVYKLVTQRLHGQITCESAPGKGTTFRLSFPITAPVPNSKSKEEENESEYGADPFSLAAC